MQPIAWVEGGGDETCADGRVEGSRPGPSCHCRPQRIQWACCVAVHQDDLSTSTSSALAQTFSAPAVASSHSVSALQDEYHYADYTLGAGAEGLTVMCRPCNRSIPPTALFLRTLLCGTVASVMPTRSCCAKPAQNVEFDASNSRKC